MAVVWLLLEVVMVFFYFDLPKVHGHDSIQKGQIQNASDESENEEANLIVKKHIVDDTSINYDSVAENSSEVFTDNSSVGGEKQKLVKVNRAGLVRKRSRTSSVMDNWHLAKGWFSLVNMSFNP